MAFSVAVVTFVFVCVLSTVRVCGRSLKEVERALPLFATQLSAGTVNEAAQVMRADCLRTTPVSSALSLKLLKNSKGMSERMFFLHF